MFNKVVLIGRLCANPELKQTPSGVSVTTFRIACNRPYTGQNGERQADFINIVAWRNQAEFVSKYFAKGDPIGVEGSIQTREYTDRDGKKRTAFEVVGDRFFFVGSRGKQNRLDVEYSTPGGFEEIEGGDDLPF